MNQLKARGSQELRPAACTRGPAGLASMRVEAVSRTRTTPLGPTGRKRPFFGYNTV
jgi:hypothetical protein